MNHDDLQDQLLAYHDGMLSEKDRAAVDAHRQTCADCAARLQEWERTLSTVLHPLAMSDSSVFVQNVMRRVRHVATANVSSAWKNFTRWAFPALALSMSSFTAAIIYTSRPAPLSTEALLQVDQDSSLSSDALASSNDDDQLVRSVVTKQ